MPAPGDHPRPLFVRDAWRSLDGTWQFALDPDAAWTAPEDVHFDLAIQVPFCPESRLSGLERTGFHRAVWYRRTVALEPHEREADLLLHFGAVDYRATVWVGGAKVAEHEGGHTPFTADVSELARHAETLEIVVRAEDDPTRMDQPRGKQDWQREPHEIWYPRTTGIWQTVWLEQVPHTRIRALHFTPNLERWELALHAHLAGPLEAGLKLRLTLSSDFEHLYTDVYEISGDELGRTVHLLDPGIDNGRSELLWSPEHPRLIDATLELLSANGETLDRVQSYTAMRSSAVGEGRFLLNGRPYFLRMVLDQGYWEDGLMTAPDDDALRRDVELAKQLGFNGARKHQKVENPRWLYWCDVLGLLVWDEMPAMYRFSGAGTQRLVREWMEVLERDKSHPCVVAWVPLNESWGVPDLARNPIQRDFVRSLYHLTRTLDPHKPCVGNDGWEHLATDLLGIHDYDQKPAVLKKRYSTLEGLAQTLQEYRPAGRLLTLPDLERRDLPAMLSEFGGVAFSQDEARGWGYHRAADTESFAAQYEKLLEAVHDCKPTLIGFCYTQLTDTFQEKNGLLSMQREPKAPLERLCAATRGERNEWQLENDPEPDPYGYSREWRSRRRRLAAQTPTLASSD